MATTTASGRPHADSSSCWRPATKRRFSAAMRRSCTDSRRTEDETVTAVYYQGKGSFALGDCAEQAPEPGEVRLDVAYCGICGTDLHIAHGAMDQRVPTPQVIGHEMSGVVA